MFVGCLLVFTGQIKSLTSWRWRRKHQRITEVGRIRPLRNVDTNSLADPSDGCWYFYLNQNGGSMDIHLLVFNKKSFHIYLRQCGHDLTGHMTTGHMTSDWQSAFLCRTIEADGLRDMEATLQGRPSLTAGCLPTLWDVSLLVTLSFLSSPDYLTPWWRSKDWWEFNRWIWNQRLLSAAKRFLLLWRWTFKDIKWLWWETFWRSARLNWTELNWTNSP